MDEKSYKLVMGIPEDKMYVLKSGEMFYFINLDVDMSPMKSEYIESFLRFAPEMEEINTTNEEDLNLIAERMKSIT